MAGRADFKGFSSLFVQCLAFLVFFAPAAHPSTSSLPLDLQGKAVNPLQLHEGKLTVLIFMRTDCPVCNRYAPVIQRLDAKYSSQGVEFWLVFPDRSLTSLAVGRYLKTYGYHCKALLDPAHFLVKRTGARITPEAVVISAGGNLIYRGRIDNWYVNLGTSRRAATVHDLDNALRETLAGEVVVEKSATAVGCYIADLE